MSTADAWVALLGTDPRPWLLASPESPARWVTRARLEDRPEHPDRRSLAELVACLVAYNVAPDGTVTPRSVYRGFAQHSFGQKKQPSPTATALLAAVVRPFADLADDISEVDVTTLTSSKGGTGTAAPPRR